MSNSSLARLQKASVKNIHIYSGALSAENIYDNYKRLTTISVPSRDFTVSGGEFKVSQEGQTGNYALLRNNQFFLSGDNAKMFINEDEILPAAQYLFQNITGTNLNFDLSGVKRDLTLKFGEGTGIGNIAGSVRYVADGATDAYHMELTENNIKNVWVSLDGVLMSPNTDYVIDNYTGVKFVSAVPKKDEEILIRQFTDTIVATPIEYTINLFMTGSGQNIQMRDMSTGTAINFTGNVDELDIENYNIYDSIVNITGSVASVRNEYSGVSTHIYNNALATATNLFNEPGSDVKAYTTSPNVFVANEGTVSYITGSDEVIIYANTGEGRVYITGGHSHIITGNVTITGGSHTVNTEDVQIYNSVNIQLSTIPYK